MRILFLPFVGPKFVWNLLLCTFHFSILHVAVVVLGRNEVRGLVYSRKSSSPPPNRNSQLSKIYITLAGKFLWVQQISTVVTKAPTPPPPPPASSSSSFWEQGSFAGDPQLLLGRGSLQVLCSSWRINLLLLLLAVLLSPFFGLRLFIQKVHK